MAPRPDGFHLIDSYERISDILDLMEAERELTLTYTFEDFFHPFVGELVGKLNRESVPGMLDPAFHADLQEAPEADFFETYYTPQDDDDRVYVDHFLTPKKIDVTTSGTYAVYNWELCFHIPLAIAVHLSKNQRFAEAQRWFHLIFDPTANDPPPDPPELYWKFIAFRKSGGHKPLGELLALLSKPDDELTTADRRLREEVKVGYQAILDNPFQPHVVARTRPIAYMYSVVMKYLDNLIAWGDHLFRQDAREPIMEAIQLYVLAANILGQRPERVPVRGTVQAKTFAQLKDLMNQGQDALVNPLVDLESLFPFNLSLPTGNEGADAAAPLMEIGRTLYFCIPPNDRLLGYWDTVADRLFKIRHCMNIEGIVRPLALFDPPLDPGMLVKAAAAGIDIGAVVAGLNQPASPVRAQLLIQKALELAAEVRGLGSSLLQSLEKEDAERLALLRQDHEVKIQQLQQEVRFLQWKQTEEATESLLRSRAVVLERYRNYLRLLGQTPDDELAPDAFTPDRAELTEENFDEAYEALVGQYDREVPVQEPPELSPAGTSPAAESGADGLGNLSLITSESREISHLGTARDLGLAASIVDATGVAGIFVPDIDINLHYWGVGGTTKLPVGTAILKGAETTAKVLQMRAAWERDQAGIASRTATYTRRASDWTFQANSAARELRQMGRQIISSLIAEQIAHREYRNVQQQIEQSQEVDSFLRSKFTNAELYAWMQGELSRLYYEYYRFAFDIARRAEQTLKRELMRPELDEKTLIRFNYWDGGRKGLLAGETLYLDCKRMEMAYHEHNLREYELTKHVSLLQVDPLAMIALRATGRCTVRLPESLFDLDGPGHYFRRIKTVALSIPSVTGPYTSVNCKLTLVRSSIRTSPQENDTHASYAREGSEDTRFQDYVGSVQSIVTSSGQQDSGMFETNLRDERYLPFENAGVISEWQLELPADPSKDDPAQFDYRTISDVILHIRYTARDAGGPLRRAALDHVNALINEGKASGSARLFAVRLEFPAEWARFTSQTPDAGHGRELALTLRPEHYPFWSQGRLNAVARVHLFAQSADGPTTIAVADRADLNDPATVKDDLIADEELGGMASGELANLADVPVLAAPTGDLKLYFDRELTDLWIAVTWSGREQ